MLTPFPQPWIQCYQYPSGRGTKPGGDIAVCLLIASVWVQPELSPMVFSIETRLQHYVLCSACGSLSQRGCSDTASVGRDNISIRLDNTDGKNKCEALHQIRSSSTPANLAFLASFQLPGYTKTGGNYFDLCFQPLCCPFAVGFFWPHL